MHSSVLPQEQPALARKGEEKEEGKGKERGSGAADRRSRTPPCG